MNTSQNPGQEPSTTNLPSRWMQPVDIASLVAFRIFLGGCILFETVRYWFEGFLKSYYVSARVGRSSYSATSNPEE